MRPRVDRFEARDKIALLKRHMLRIAVTNGSCDVIDASAIVHQTVTKDGAEVKPIPQAKFE